MLTLLSLLQARRDWRGPELAARLGVSDRTLRRDVERLRELGYHITAVKGPDGGYRLDPGAELPPLLFDEDQAVALAVALQTAASSGAVTAEAALRALTTVRHLLPSRLRHRADAVAFTTISDARAGAVDTQVLLAVSAAVRAQHVLRLDYTAVGEGDEGAASRRRVEPHHVLFASGRWYLLAWDLDVDDWRIFRLDRLRPSRPTGPRFHPREVPGGAREFVTARFRGSSRADAWPCIGEAVLHTPARNVAPFIVDGTVEEVSPDACRVVIGSWSWPALAAAFGLFDAPISRVWPPELADAFAELSTRFARAAHRDEEADSPRRAETSLSI